MNTGLIDDSVGKLWIGSINQGIYTFDKVKWEKSFDSIPKGIFDMILVNGDIWAAANGGLIRIPNFEISNAQVLKYSDTVSNFFWSVAYDSTGTVWVGSGDVTKTLLLAYKNGEWKEIDCKSLGEQSYIPAIVVDSKNRKWFVSDAGLSMYNDTTFVTYNHTNSTLPITSFTHLEIDSKGNLWIGTVGFGLYKFDELPLQIFHIPTLYFL
jgi:ligand-binding sensor domain-containing protein